MEFISPLLAYLGAATFSIPVIIHLIFRMRKRRIVFSSLRFLQMSMLKESKRLKLRELILLLLRCLACILIAMAFARPFFRSNALAGSSGRVLQDVVVVLDDSPSMSAQEGAGIRWTDALKKAREEVAQRVSGDRVALVLVSDPARAEIELSGNFAAVNSALNAERPSALRGDLTAAMNTAVDLLAASTQARRRVVVYSDFQSNAIDRGAWSTLAQKAASIGNGVAVELQGPAGAASALVRLPDLAITDLRAKNDVWIEGRPVPFAVRVANYGDNERPSVIVKLVVDGKPVATRTIGLGPRSSTDAELEAIFPRAGEVSGEALIDAHDAFPDDDKRLFALRLRDSVKVLVLEEHLSETKSYYDEGYRVRMALEPKARGDLNPNAGAGNYVQVISSELAHITPDMCRNADLIVLCGINAMTEPALATLEEAVHDGKNLILFAGSIDSHGDLRLSDSFYNGAFWKNGLGLLPARPGTIYEGSLRDNKYDRIGIFDQNHPLFSTFTGESESILRLPRFYKHFKINPEDLKIGSEEKTAGPKLDEPKPLGDKKAELVRPAGKVIATFTGDGGPFAVERSYGKGTILMFPFPARVEATDLPNHNAFVPLLHQAVRWLAGVQSASRRSLIAGDSFAFADAGAAPDTAVSLEKPPAPKGTKETLNLTGNDHPIADLPGIYAASFIKGTIKERTLWAVNIDPRESELVSESVSSLKNIFATASTPESPKAMLAEMSDEQKRQAAEWRWCLLAALACLLLEVALRDFWGS